MPYALNDAISKSPLEGGVEISNQQYAEALEAKLIGREAVVLGGTLVIRDRAPSPGHTWKNGEWVQPTPPEPEPVDPLELALGRIQYEFMIEKLGIKAAVEAAIDALPESTEAEQNAKIMAGVLHRSGTEFHRGHPLFTELAPAVGFSTQQIDDAWTQATQLTW